MSRDVDWSKLGAVAGHAQWIRKKSGALCVLVIRRDDSTVAADQALPAQELRTLIDTHLPGLIEDLRQQKAEKRKPARLTWDELRE